MSAARADAPVRIALVLGGGASLGAYVAGAASELLEALESDPRGRVTVGVLAGASAGAVTAALAARALTVNPSLLPLLRNLWVEALDVEALLDPGRTNRAGLLDDAAVRELGRVLITADPASDDRPSPLARDRIGLGIALSNLTGVPYPLRYAFRNAPERRCDVRVHRDGVAFDLDVPTPASAPVWERVRDATLASAAFPFAFPPVRLERGSTDFPGSCLPAAATGSMWYTDGGLFANEPIGLAKRLVERDPDYRSEDWRYILIDPDVGEARSPSDPPRSLAGVAGALTRAVLGQAAASDWARATETNTRVAVLEALVARLPEIAHGLCDPDALRLGREVGRLAEHVAEERARRSGSAHLEDSAAMALKILDDSLRRIQADPRFARTLERVETRAARTRLAKLIFILEAAGDLGDKRVLPLYLVAPPSDAPLAGGALGNFGGFLSREWRTHDFEAGRRDAARLLVDDLSELVEYGRDPSEFAVELPAPSSFTTAPAAARSRVDDFVDAETDRVLDAIRPGLLIRALGFLWKPAVRRWVRRRVHESLAELDGGRAT